VRRDRHMTRLAQTFPQYGFERHKGYGTKKHYEALRAHGLCEIHRKSFLTRLQAPSTTLQTSSKFR
jgi:ribonuclease HII